MVLDHDAINKSVNCDILDWKGSLRIAAINTVAIWKREVKNQVPFSQLVAIWKYPKTAHIGGEEKGLAIRRETSF